MQSNMASRRHPSATTPTASNIYQWCKCYDGTLQSLVDHSQHPHRSEEIVLIDNLRHRPPNTGLVVFWVKLRQRWYTGSISGLFYRLLWKRGQTAVKLPNSKYMPKSYEHATYHEQPSQLDIKFVPDARLIGDAAGQKFYQYTFIDVYSPLSLSLSI